MDREEFRSISPHVHFKKCLKTTNLLKSNPQLGSEGIIPYLYPDKETIDLKDEEAFQFYGTP